jgi:hypothetical protein
MGNIKRQFLWIIPGAFVLYAVLTGGVAVEKVNNFGGQRNIVLVHGLDSDICLSSTSLELHIPFLFHYYSECKPFDLSLQIWDTKKQYQRIVVNEILVEYDDGEIIHKTNAWDKDLKPYTQYNSSSSGCTETQMLMLSDEIPNLVLRHANVKITLTGQLIKQDGQSTNFKVSEHFEVESRTSITTFWEVISSC